MPIKIPDNLPTMEILTQENIFVMAEERAIHQDIRPLEVVILNLMPTKIVTETQLLRLLGNSALQVNITLLHPRSHTAKNTPAEHLLTFYKTLDCIRERKFDGMIVTGAPVEQMEFTEVDFWEEFKEILDWAENHVFCTMYICWGAQAGLYHHYGIPKYPLEQKLFGVYQHRVNKQFVRLLRGFDDWFCAPHSRHTEVRQEDIAKIPQLEILAESPEAGVYLATSKDNRKIFVTGHAEYDPLTLQDEYLRDVQKGMNITVPENYYPNNDPCQEPVVKWRGHANLLFANFLNYYVYQETPYNLAEL